MKISIWDILSVLVLIGAVIVIAIVASIFANPISSLNPFPPATLPPTIMIPTSTPTQVRLPSTWTPAPVISATPRPTSTPFPTATSFRITSVVNTKSKSSATPTPKQQGLPAARR